MRCIGCKRGLFEGEVDFCNDCDHYRRTLQEEPPMQSDASATSQEDKT